MKIHEYQAQQLFSDYAIPNTSHHVVQLDSLSKVPEYLDWFIWRPIIAGKASKQELDNPNTYTITDMLDLHDAMDLDYEAQVKAAAPKPKSHPKPRRRRAG